MRVGYAGVIGIVVLDALAFAAVQRRDEAEITDVLLRVNGPLHLAAGDSARTVVVIGHDADVEGTVAEQLVVIGGTARVSGKVRGTLVVVHGRPVWPEAEIGERGAPQSALERAPGADRGVVHRREGIEWSPSSVDPVAEFTLVALVVALGFAAVAGRQLFEAAGGISEKRGLSSRRPWWWLSSSRPSPSWPSSAYRLDHTADRNPGDAIPRLSGSP